MNKRIFDLLRRGKGTSPDILPLWRSMSLEEKKELTLEQCQRAWNNFSWEIPEKAEAWSLVKSKTKTFRQRQWIWSNTKFNSKEGVEAWKFVKAGAKTSEECQWVKKRDSSCNGSEKEKNLIENKVLSFSTL